MLAPSTKFDGIDAFLFIGGMFLLVIVCFVVASEMPAFWENLTSNHPWSRAALLALVSFFAFGPLLLRRQVFPGDAGREVVVRQGLLFRAMSVVGLLLIVVGFSCMGILGAGLFRPPAETYEAFVARAELETMDLTELSVLAEVEAEWQRGGSTDTMQEAVTRGEERARADRRASIDAQWEDYQQLQVQQHEQLRTRGEGLLLTTLLSFGVAIALLRARYVRSPAPSAG
jgi:hypothetical protein